MERVAAIGEGVGETPQVVEAGATVHTGQRDFRRGLRRRAPSGECEGDEQGAEGLVHGHIWKQAGDRCKVCCKPPCSGKAVCRQASDFAENGRRELAASPCLAEGQVDALRPEQRMGLPIFQRQHAVIPQAIRAAPDHDVTVVQRSLD